MIRDLIILPLIFVSIGSGMPSANAQSPATQSPTTQSPTTQLPATQSRVRESIDQLFLDAAVIRLQHSKDYTLAVAELMPEDKYDFKPTKEEMSFAEQLLHIASRLDWLTSQYLFREAKEADPFKAPDSPYKKKEVMATVAQAYDYTIDKIKHFDLSNLTDSVYFEYMGAGRVSKLQYINLLDDHQAHHRGQLMVYLHLNGITPPEYMGL